MRNSPVLLVHHAANRHHANPSNSIRGLQVCLDAKSRAVEMDISPLADGNFVLLHNQLLEHGTNGFGPVSDHTADEVSSLRLTEDGAVSDEPVGLLSQALELITRHPHPVELQLDLKPYTFLADEVLSRLVSALDPVRDRVRVSSISDFALRRLRALDSDLLLGFDPLLYLDVKPSGDGRENAEPMDVRPPVRLGAYGYWDDHPSALQRSHDTAEYLNARVEALWSQAPSGAIWYIHAPLLARALNDGFNWIAFLHARGTEVDTWTLEPDVPGHAALARRFIAAGIDRITTNDAPDLAKILGGGVEF